MPLALRGSGQLNYDDSREVPNNVASKRGFNLIQQHFSKGTSEPTTLYLSGSKKIDNERSLKEIDRLTEQIKHVSGVKSVLSATQPGGNKIKSLYVDNQLATNTNGLTKVTNGLAQLREGVSSAKSQLAQADFASQLKSVQALSSGASELASSSQQMTTALSTISQQVNEANSQVSELVTNLQTIGMSDGVDSLQSGSSQLSSAMEQVKSASQELTTGAKSVADGNQQMYQTLTGLQQKVTDLKSGLNQMDEGLQQENQGTSQIGEYLAGLQKSSASKVFYIPNSELHSQTYSEVLGSYFSYNRHATQLTIIFKGDPSDTKTMQQMGKIEKIANNSLKGTSLEHTQKAFDGMTSYNRDLSSLASKDFKRTAALMLVGILIALLVVTRSLLQSLTIEGILVTVYYAALSVVHGLSSVFLGESQLAWNTPFFAFIMLIALGVDYSIFLMVKYRDLTDEDLGRKRQIIQAATTIGVTVISAGIILAGTFAAMIPSGVMTLIQVAMVVILGIVLLVITIPIVLPIIIRVQNWAILGSKKKS